MPNFSSLAGLEVAEKFVVVGWGGEVEHVTTVSDRSVVLTHIVYSTDTNSVQY